jgi:Regulator of chromosome condensation (RCC1) repeat
LTTQTDATRCFGDNQFGQLVGAQAVASSLKNYSCPHIVCIALLCCRVQGYGNTNDALTMRADEVQDVFLGIGVSATDISAGLFNTCVILSNKKVLCWGDNTSGKPIFIFILLAQ